MACVSDPQEQYLFFLMQFNIVRQMYTWAPAEIFQQRGGGQNYQHLKKFTRYKRLIICRHNEGANEKFLCFSDILDWNIGYLLWALKARVKFLGCFVGRQHMTSFFFKFQGWGQARPLEPCGRPCTYIWQVGPQKRFTSTAGCKIKILHLHLKCVELIAHSFTITVDLPGRYLCLDCAEERTWLDVIVRALHQLKRSLRHVVQRQSRLDSCDLNRVPCLQTDSLQVTHEVTVRSEPILCFSAHTHTYKYTVSVNKPKSCMKFTYESMHILCSTFDVNTHTHTHKHAHICA